MNQPNPKPPVFMKCKNPKCDSIEAVEIKNGNGVRAYQCVKCKRAHGVLVGGKMDLRSI